MAKYRHEVLAAILRVSGDGKLQVITRRRRREPFSGTWGLPSGPVEPAETLDQAMTRHLEQGPYPYLVRHSEQLETFSDPYRDPFERTIATAYLGLVTAQPPDADQSASQTDDSVAWWDVDALPKMAFDHDRVVGVAVGRLRAKLSYTNIAFAMTPQEFTLARLRQIYCGALGHDVDVTNLGRILTRRGQIEPTGRREPSGTGGGRPARTYRFTKLAYHVTDPFAVLRP